MAIDPDDLRSLREIDRTLAATLSLQCDHFGFVPNDACVRESIRQGKPLLSTQPDSAAAKAITRIARRIVRLWDETIEDSASLLLRDTQKAYEK